MGKNGKNTRFHMKPRVPRPFFSILPGTAGILGKMSENVQFLFVQFPLHYAPGFILSVMIFLNLICIQAMKCFRRLIILWIAKTKNISMNIGWVCLCQREQTFPQGYEAIDFPKMTIGVCNVYGKRLLDYCYPVM